MIDNAKRPSVSVIIPTLNAAGTLQHALNSLAGQDVCYEAILVDGGSIDATRTIAASAPRLRVIAAPGTSIYEALNRGIAAALAPAIVLLNADDALSPGALKAFLDALERMPAADIARGRPHFVEKTASGAMSVPVADRAARRFGLRLLLRGACGINAFCIRRSVFDRIGFFDTRYRLAADREWMLRLWTKSFLIAELDRPVYRYTIHEGSSTFDRARQNYELMRKEHINIVSEYLAKAEHAQWPESTVPALRRWHAAETMMLALRQARAADWSGMGSNLKRAFATAPMWPFSFVVDGASWTLRRLFR
jgi:glycosyltransferase involved in cell wall biosynthesis